MSCTAATAVARLLQPPVGALLAFPAGTTIRNRFLLDRESARTPLDTSVADPNTMAEAVERLLTEITYVLSMGLVERHELWTVLETLSLVPEKVAIEAALREEAATTTGASDSATGPSRQSSPAAGAALHGFARRIQFASQLIFVVQNTFKEFPAPVRTRAFLRLALNQGCLLAALELIARYNRSEIAVYYKQPWRSVLLQYDVLEVRVPGLADPARATTSVSSSSGGRWSWRRERPSQKVASPARATSTTTTTTTRTTAEDHCQTPLRSSRPASDARASASPPPRAPITSSAITPTPIAASAATTTGSSSSELWGTFVATLSAVGGVPLCALEDGSMTKGFTLVPFDLDLTVHGLDDDFPVAEATTIAGHVRTTMTASSAGVAPFKHSSSSTRKCFLQLLGEYIYDLIPSAPNAYACCLAVHAREAELAQMEASRKPASAVATEAAATAIGSTTPTSLVQVLPAAPGKQKRGTTTTTTARTQTKRKKSKTAVHSSTASSPSSLLVVPASSSPLSSRQARALHAVTQPPSSASSASNERPVHSRTLTEDGEAGSDTVHRLVSASAGRTHEALTSTAQDRDSYVAAAVRETEGSAEASTRPLLAQLRVLKRLSNLNVEGVDGDAAADKRAVDAPKITTRTTRTTTMTTMTTSSGTPPEESAHEVAHHHAQRRRRAGRGSFELQPDGSVMRCAVPRSTPSPPPSTTASVTPATTPSPPPLSSSPPACAEHGEQHAVDATAAVMATLVELEKAVQAYCTRVADAAARREAIAMGRYDVDADG